MLFPVRENTIKTKSIRNRKSAEEAGKKLILFVDDEVLMQDLGKELLEEHGFRVIVAADGVEAIEVYRKHSQDIDLVILDILMPRLDGGQTYLELKKINKDIKAFFCTGYTPQDVIGSLLAEESLRALQKPFRPNEFVRTVHEVLASN